MQAHFDLHSFLPYRINRLAERVSQSLSGVYARRFQISVAQWRVLAILQAHPGMSAKAVAASSNMDKVRVSRAVARLTERGLLLSERAASDARASELRLTAHGVGLFRAIAPLAMDWEREFLTILSDQDRSTLSRILDTLENHMLQSPMTVVDSQVAES